MNTEIIKAFTKVTKDVFLQMMNLPVEAQMIHVLDMGRQRDWNIIGIIGLAGDVKGAISIGFSTASGKSITAAMGLEDTADNTAELVQELVNIIAGNSKQELQDVRKIARKVDISLPSVSMGAGGITTYFPRGVDNFIGIPFRLEDGAEFELVVGFEGL